MNRKVLREIPDDEVALQAKQVITKVVNGVPIEQAIDGVNLEMTPLRVKNESNPGLMLPKSWAVTTTTGAVL